MISSTENAPKPKPDENSHSNRITVRVPVQLTILIPIEIDSDEQITDTGDLLFSSSVVDATQNIEVFERVAKQLPTNDAVIKALAALHSVGLKIKTTYPKSKILFTPWAGIQEEIEI